MTRRHYLERELVNGLVKVSYEDVDDEMVRIVEYKRLRPGHDRHQNVKHMKGKILPRWQLTGEGAPQEREEAS